MFFDSDEETLAQYRMKIYARENWKIHASFRPNKLLISAAKMFTSYVAAPT